MYSVSFHLLTYIHQKILKINKLHCTSCKHNTFKIKSYGILCKYTQQNQITAPVLIGCVNVDVQSLGVTESEELPKATEIILQM